MQILSPVDTKVKSTLPGNTHRQKKKKTYLTEPRLAKSPKHKNWLLNGENNEKLPKEDDGRVSDELRRAIWNRVKNRKADMSQIKATVLEWLHQLQFPFLPIIILYSTEDQTVNRRVESQSRCCHNNSFFFWWSHSHSFDYSFFSIVIDFDTVICGHKILDFVPKKQKQGDLN